MTRDMLGGANSSPDDRSSSPSTDRAAIEVREQNGGVVIRLTGPINEHFDPAPLRAAASYPIVIIDLDGVPWITSFGVREWIRALADLAHGYLAFLHVRPIVVQQFNMVAGFAGHGQLLSFYAPYLCPHCDHAQEQLIDLCVLHPVVKQSALPPVACDKCHGPSELDELAESYLQYAAAARAPEPPPELTRVLHGAPITQTLRPLRVTKQVHGTVTHLALAGALDARAQLKRVAAGLEGSVVVSLSEIRTFDAAGLARLAPLWQAAAEVYLVAAPLALARALPAEAWRALQIFSLIGELTCAAGHVLRHAVVHHDELCRLVRGEDPLRCPQCDQPLASSDVRALAAAGAIRDLPAATRAVITDVLARVISAAAAPTRDVAGEPFGRYTLHKLLGTGGMAEVFLAGYDLGGCEKLVVLKRILGHLSRDERFIAMFLSEARLAARIRHPNVVQIQDLGQIADRHFIVMEYVQGWDLSWLISFARQVARPFPLHIAAAICAQIAAGLDAAHSALDPQGQPSPIIHRDVSPHNVLVSRDGAIKLTDFGIAKATTRGALTPTMTVKGKLSYLAPEVALASDPIDPRADLFPLGIILHELVTLQKLFRRTSDYATMHALLHEDIPALRTARADVPIALDEIARRALARDPRARYPSARALQRDLEAFVESTEMIASPRALSAYVCQLAADAAMFSSDGDDDETRRDP